MAIIGGMENIMQLSIYLINLDSSTARLADADLELKKHELSYERISAVDGRKFDVHSYPSYDSNKAQYYTGRDLIGSEIGCYLSHKKALERFVASGSIWGLILEDDLNLCDGFKSLIQETIVWIEQSKVRCDVVNLVSNKRKLSRPLVQIQGRDLLHAYYFPISALGLLWSREGAQAFLQQMNDIYMPIDVEIQKWASKTGHGLSLVPALVKISGAESDIDANTIAMKKDSLRVDRFIPKQRRMWGNKWNAFKHKYSISS